MKNSSICMKCQKQISALRIAMYWPSKISCKGCSAQHHYRFAHIIGVFYTLLLIIATLIPVAYSGNFENVRNGIYSTSGLQLIVKFGGMAIAFLVVGFAYGKFMKAFFVLRSNIP